MNGDTNSHEWGGECHEWGTLKQGECPYDDNLLLCLPSDKTTHIPTVAIGQFQDWYIILIGLATIPPNPSQTACQLVPASLPPSPVYLCGVGDVGESCVTGHHCSNISEG